MADKKQIQEAHEKGQKDGAKNSYHNPWDGGYVGWGWDKERDEAYKKGWENGRSGGRKG